MVKLVLEVSMKLENIQKVEAEPDKRWYLKITCTSCHEMSPKWHYVTMNETFPKTHGKGTGHFVFHCSACKRESTLNILEGSIKAYEYKEDKEEDYQPLISFDARGLEPYDFEPRDDWIVMGPKKRFNEVAFENGTDWSDYDDIANEPVSILEFTHRFKKI